jgi:hypothetical protein
MLLFSRIFNTHTMIIANRAVISMYRVLARIEILCRLVQKSGQRTVAYGARRTLLHRPIRRPVSEFRKECWRETSSNPSHHPTNPVQVSLSSDGQPAVLFNTLVVHFPIANANTQRKKAKTIAVK